MDLPHSEADIFGSLNITNLTLALASQDCHVKSIYERDESLENYFMNLVGGDHNATVQFCSKRV